MSRVGFTHRGKSVGRKTAPSLYKKIAKATRPSGTRGGKRR